jgi:hypothetical protein
MQDAKPADREKQHKTILAILDTETQLRSKKELIERFIAHPLSRIFLKGGDVGEEFETYWNAEKEKAIKELSDTEGLYHDRSAQGHRRLSVHRKTPDAGRCYWNHGKTPWLERASNFSGTYYR